MQMLRLPLPALDGTMRPVSQIHPGSMATGGGRQVAQQGHQFNQAADDDSALDQMPRQRNMISPAQAAHNRAIMNQTAARPNMPTNQQSNVPGMQAALGGNNGGIAQPPHQAGQRFAGPRSKIDPDQIPSPVEMQDADQDFFDKEWFATCGRGGMPLSTTSFAAVDKATALPNTFDLPRTACPPPTNSPPHLNFPSPCSCNPSLSFVPTKLPFPSRRLAKWSSALQAMPRLHQRLVCLCRRRPKVDV